MYCPNCGEANCEELAKEHSEAFLERGDHDNDTNTYSMEQDATVLECRACQLEFIVL